MKTLLRSLVFCLLLVAIPFQGFAAASMLVCAPMAPSEHVMMQSHAASSDHPAVEKSTGCANCCFGAAMAPYALSRVPAAKAQTSFFQCDACPLARVDLALPERPPQASLT